MPVASSRYVDLQPGDPAPWFKQRSTSNPRYVFDTVAGRYIVLCLFGSAADPLSRSALEAVTRARAVFDDGFASFFGVSADPADEQQRRVRESLPGLRFFWDFDGLIGRLYGALPAEGASEDAGLAPRRRWVVLGPTLRVVAVVPFAPGDTGAARVLALLRGLPPPDRWTGHEVAAPVLLLPDVFEPALRQALVDAYEAHGGEESGFMREANGKTVEVRDASHKIRRDHTLVDPRLIARARERIQRRVVPEIAKAHQFHVTRMERHLVACYAAEDGAHFRAHRDNTTKGTAHRRFAVSVNLNAEFDGGEVGFPEYGPRLYKPAPGAAVVFSCSLLHQVSPVTRGRRYAFLPFLYDEAAARKREANRAFLAESVGTYRPN